MKKWFGKDGKLQVPLEEINGIKTPSLNTVVTYLKEMNLNFL